MKYDIQPKPVSGKWIAAAALVLVLSIAGLVYDNWEQDTVVAVVDKGKAAAPTVATAPKTAPAPAATPPVAEAASPVSTATAENPLPPAANAEAAAWYAEGKKYMNQNDWKQAVPYFEKAAAKGHDGALVNLGVAYLEGRGVKQDIVYGCRLMEQAAEVGNQADAWSNLGLCIEDLPDPDYAKAAAAYQKAAMAGMPDAQLALGRLYVTGRGVPQESSVGLYWFGMAAGSDPNAVRVLSQCFLTRECSKQYYDPAIGYALLLSEGRYVYKPGLMTRLRKWYREVKVTGDISERDREHGEAYWKEWSALDDRAMAEKALLESGAIKAQQ